MCPTWEIIRDKNIKNTKSYIRKCLSIWYVDTMKSFHGSSLPCNFFLTWLIVCSSGRYTFSHKNVFLALLPLITLQWKLLIPNTHLLYMLMEWPSSPFKPATVSNKLTSYRLWLSWPTSFHHNSKGLLWKTWPWTLKSVRFGSHFAHKPHRNMDLYLTEVQT